MKMPIFTSTLVSLLFGLASPNSQASPEPFATENQNIIPLCSAAIAYRYRDEVNLPGKPDKYKHCALSCVMTLYCGPIGSFEVGALKELYDALGFGTPDVEDIKADIRGIKSGLKIGLFGERARCYQACSALFP
ncbi:MAG: hypothetical protein KGP28_11970 [Bdellovibrionales bacterium]|nr:hypothetical protein [Bdellovibrionales bacterium]